MEGDIALQLEGVGEAILAWLVAICQHRLELVQLVDHVEAFEDIGNRHPLGGFAGIFRAEALDRILRKNYQSATGFRGCILSGGTLGHSCTAEHWHQSGSSCGLQHGAAVRM